MNLGASETAGGLCHAAERHVRSTAQLEANTISLRQATARDMEFLRRVHREAMRPHVERTWGTWNEADQRKRFDESSDPASHEIIEVSGAPVGCQWVRRHPDAFELVRLYILPEFQGRGIGTRLLSSLCGEAASQGVPIRLRVMRENQAQQLYRRLGFLVVSETETHLLMTRAV